MENLKLLSRLQLNQNTMFYKSYIYIYMIILICNCIGLSQSGEPCDASKIGALSKSFIDPNSNPSQFPKVCIKIKFHFVKENRPTSETVPSERIYADWLNGLNTAYESGNIHFTFDGDCPDVVDLGQDTIPSGFAAWYKIRNNPGLFGYDANAINIYATSKFGGGAGIRGDNILMSAGPIPTLVHELGHILGLWHTFGKGNPDYYRTPFEHPWECKDGTNLNGHQSDGIADTPADAYTMDLDNDGLADEWDWFNNSACLQKQEINSYPDDCNDTTLDWTIPLDNWMSYYGNCKEKKFTNGQYEVMHEFIVNSFQAAVVTDCENDPYFNPVDCQNSDIIIDQPTIWQNGTMQLCKNQKILIEGSGSLTLINYKITKQDGPYPNCPGLSKLGNWDGIYLYPYTTGSGLPNGPALRVLGNSIIEYSENGINAFNFDKIEFSNSVFRNNGLGIYARNGLQGLLITNNSLIDASASKALREIYLNNCRGSIINSIISGSGMNTGIFSYYGALYISKSRIESFQTVIEKEQDKITGGFQESFGSSGSGLVIQNSDLISSYDKYQAIRIQGCKDVYVYKNYIHGSISATGISSGNWLSNNFKFNVLIISPQNDYLFSNNLFYGSQLELYNAQSLTNAICNRWQTDGTNAVAANAYPLKASWGSKNMSSGNQHVASTSPTMNSADPRQEITNYFDQQNPLEEFQYQGEFKGGESDLPIATCLYDYKSGVRQYDNNQIEDCDTIQLLQTWDSLNYQLVLQNQELETEIDSIQIVILKGQISELSFQKSAISSKALRCLRAINLQSQLYLDWVNKLDPELITLNQISELWNNENFEAIALVSGISLEANNDFQVLVNAAQMLADFVSDSVNIYALSLEQLQGLNSIAHQSYGDYSNELRAWLNAYYSIQIDWPLPLWPYASKSKAGKKKEASHFKIIPNPFEDCFQIRLSENEYSELNFKIGIYDNQGKKVFNAECKLNEYLCLPSLLRGSIYFIRIYDLTGNQIEASKVIFK
ncbi:MAG: right-handed parallel beta-helix repeat-containing protein [Saprospiraceae bacterium]|nr:right-handed parallel beta-helix repeat-containing protein [Saprospiraceae bacterium]